MDIVVTGGAGYVGYSVCRTLAYKYPKSKIIIYDNFSKARLDSIELLLNECQNVILIPWDKADIRDDSKFKSVLNEYKPEAVIHLAAIVDAFTTNREGKDIECNIVNNISAVRVANLCKDSGVKRFIFQSTVSLYSRGENLLEDSPKDPLSTYGSSKLEAEKNILKLDDKNFSTCALRSATIVGYNPSFRYETIINMLCIRSVYNMETTIFQSALKNQKSYLSLEDEASAIIFALDNINQMKGGAYNVSSFNTNLDVVIKSIEKTGITPVVKISDEKTINQQVYTVNSDKIKQLGFNPSSQIENIIQETITGVIKRKKALELIK